ncbi:MAG: hypothetical protein J1E64_00385 [Acetatifactor sp.]|nr:hypothetical protein [Acetatifactor sp.]
MSKWCLILGSGFGLYGYLPAVSECGYKVIIPARYRAKFESRQELVIYSDTVHYIEDDEDIDSLTGNLDLLVIARRPSDQVDVLKLICDKHAINLPRKVILEKPLAASPDEALEIWSHISNDNSQMQFRMGYTFFYTVWGREVLKHLHSDEGCVISITWDFEAHHFTNDIDTWKRYEQQGGGALRFYGIQVIGLLASAAEWKPVESEMYANDNDEDLEWNCVVVSGLHKVKVHIDSRSKRNGFGCVISRLDALDANSSVLYEYSNESPFDLSNKIDRDLRVDIIKKIVGSFDNPGSNIYTSSPNETCIGASLKLWKAIEDCMVVRKVYRESDN